MKTLLTLMPRGMLVGAVAWLMMPVLLNAQAPAPALVGYWQNWYDPASPYIPLPDIDSRYNVIQISFGTPINGTDYEIGFTPDGISQATFISQVQGLQAQGKKVLLSIGGANDPVSLDTYAERDVFVSSVTGLLNTYGFDGIDIDFEGSSLSVSSNSTIASPVDSPIIYLIEAIKTIMANYRANNNNQKMLLTFAPETALVQGGMSQWGGLWGAYLPVLHALRDSIDLLHVQLYNSGSMYGIDGGIYNQGTADFIVAMCEALIQGFDVPLSGNTAGPFQGFPESKIAVGLPACPSAAGGGFTPTATVAAAINYLRGQGPKPGSYTLAGGPYPDLAGMMTWSINWDALSTCNSTSYEFAANFEDIFLAGPCWKPNLGPDVSACDISFPYTLDSGTPTNTNVTFTWKNLTTNQTLVSNSATANTWNISAAGTYRVIRDSAGCSKSDDIAVLEDLPTPALPATENICAVVPLTLTASNAGSFPSGTTFQWYQDGSPLTGETSTTLTNIRVAGDYKLVAQKNICTTESTSAVSSALPEPIDGCTTAGNAAQLAVRQTSSSTGPYTWYDSSTGGTALGTGTTFTTPPLNATTTYYVEDASSISTSTTGPPAADNGLGTLQNWVGPKEIIFDAHLPFTLKEVTVYPAIWCYTHTLTFEIRDNAGNVLPNGAQSFSITDDTDCGTISGAVTLTLSNGGVQIPAGTGYKLVQTGSIGFNHWSGSVSYPMSYSPIFTITGGSSSTKYMAVHDWVVESSCARMPVVAEVSTNCAPMPVELVSFTAKPHPDGVELQWATASETDNMGFFVLRQTDRTPFDTVGWVDAAGTAHTYDFLDRTAPRQEQLYYQLLQVDWNGQTTRSPVVSVLLEGDASGFALYPNPADQSVYLRDSDAAAIDRRLVRLFDMQGRLLLEREWEGPTLQMDVAQLPAGAYLITVNRRDRMDRKVLIIR